MERPNSGPGDVTESKADERKESSSVQDKEVTSNHEVSSEFEEDSSSKEDAVKVAKNLASGGDKGKASKPKPAKKGAKAKKKPKDMPRRPLSAYNFFFREERQKLLTQVHVDEKEAAAGKGNTVFFAKIGKMVAERWKDVSPEDLERYKKLAEEDMDRYRQEMNEYQLKIVRMRRQKREMEEKARQLNAQQENAQSENAAATAAVASGGFAQAPGALSASTTQPQNVGGGQPTNMLDLLASNASQGAPLGSQLLQALGNGFPSQHGLNQALFSSPDPAAGALQMLLGQQQQGMTPVLQQLLQQQQQQAFGSAMASSGDILSALLGQQQAPGLLQGYQDNARLQALLNSNVQSSGLSSSNPATNSNGMANLLHSLGNPQLPYNRELLQLLAQQQQQVQSTDESLLRFLLEQQQQREGQDSNKS